MENQLSVYQHPALTVLIDDNQSYLTSLQLQLNPQRACKTFVDARAALGWITRAYRDSAHPDPIRVGFDEEAASFDKRKASINVDEIYQISANPKRFDLPAVVVVDYSMSSMDGLEFCRAIKELPCKKILLTGQADEKIAVEAFNENLIHRYIRKTMPDALPHLQNEIRKLQNEFFLEQGKTLLDLLSRNSYFFLKDPAIKQLTLDLSQRYRFVEHYLFPNPTGILFFDHQGSPTLLVIETEDSLLTQYEVAEQYNAPAELLNALREHRLVPFFHATGGMFQEEISDDWLSYCLPANICHGREDYYWALFELPKAYLSSAIQSYAEYLGD